MNLFLQRILLIPEMGIERSYESINARSSLKE
jgi:hypothetical protein